MLSYTTKVFIRKILEHLTYAPSCKTITFRSIHYESIKIEKKQDIIRDKSIPKTFFIRIEYVESKCSFYRTESDGIRSNLYS